MEFMKNCGTGIQTLSGWTTFNYEVYVTKLSNRDIDDNGDRHDAQTKKTPVDPLTELEFILRQHNYIVQPDVKRQYMWVFMPATEHESFAHGSPDIGKLLEGQDVDAKLMFKGIFTSSDLASQQQLTRHVAPSRPPTINGQNNMEYFNSLRRSEIYAMFICALSATLSFRLASNSSFQPLAKGVFVCVQSSSPSESNKRAPGYVTAVGSAIYLTSTGVLVISLFPLPSLRLLSVGESLAVHAAASGLPLVLAPISYPASYVAQSEPLLSEFMSSWRALVIIWLARKGLSLPNLDRIENWVTVESRTTDSANIVSKSKISGFFLWPTAFSYICGKLDASHAAALDEIAVNPSGKQKGSLHNLLQFAEQWSQGHQERERQLLVRRQKRKQQTVLPNPTPNHALAASPINSRSITYGETHGTNGVYPTPPDGLSSHAIATANMLAPSPLQSTDVPSTFASQSGKEMLLDARSAEIQPETDNMHDDLFEEMEEDDFAGNDITDADFNFFDEEFEDGPGQTSEENAGDGAPPDAQPLAKVEEGSKSAVMGSKVSPGEILEPEADGELDSALEQDDTTLSSKQTIHPLDPEEVLRRLFSIESESNKRELHRGSMFGPVTFNSALEEFHGRYELPGPFGFKLNSIVPKKRSSKDDGVSVLSPPSPKKLLRAATFQSRVTRDDDSDDDSSSIILPNSNPHDEKLDAVCTSHPDLASNSNDKSDGNVNDETQHELDTVAMFEELLIFDRGCNLITQGGALSSIQQSGSDRGQPSKVIKSAHPFTVNFIATAQIVADQIVHSTLNHVAEQVTVALGENNIQTSARGHSLIQAFQRTSTRLMGVGDQYSLVKYASIQDPAPDQAIQRPQPRPPAPKPLLNLANSSLAGIPILLPAQYVRVRRNDALWDMRSSAIAFWDVLGLAPTNGPKSAAAYVLYPDRLNLDGISSQLMKEIGQCYENCKLGKHIYDIPAPDMSLKFNSFRGENGEISSSYHMQCVKVGGRLAMMDYDRSKSNSSRDKKPVIIVDARVIYVINPCEDASILHNIAYGFLALKDAYRRTKTPVSYRKPDVVLQIIPLSSIHNVGEVVLLDSATAHMLAREVYNRCPPVSPNEDAGALAISSGSSIQLMETIPRKIAFELSADPPSNIMQDPSHLHLGYAISQSGNWVTAAYSDNSGKYQAVVSYCLTGSRTFSDIAKEIWQTSIDIMKPRRVNWRLYILKVGIMTTDEMESWASLALTPQPFALVTLLSSMDFSPPLSLLPQITLPTSPPAWTFRTSAPTPIGTPNTQPGVSPDPSAQTPAAGTPSENTTIADAASNDPDAHLVDMTDETWTIILGHRVTLPTPSATSHTDFLQALSSALLIRVPPTAPASNPFNPAEILDPFQAPCVALHLLWARNSAKSSVVSSVGPDTPPTTPSGASATGNPSAVPKAASDNIMRESLAYLRNLALLAKVRGVKDGKAGLIPWHALIAARGVDGLDGVYGLERWAPLEGK